MSHAKTLKPGIVRHIPRSSSHEAKRHVWLHKLNKEFVKAAAKTTAGGVLLAVGASLVLQLVYPRTMTLPQTRIGGQAYGFQTKGKIASNISALGSQEFTFKSGSQTFKYSPVELGITLTGSRDADQATQYTWKERLVPFSFFFERRDIPHYSFTVDEAKAKKFAQGLQQYNRAPVDASVHLENMSAVVVKQQNGFAYDAEHMVTSIKDMKLTSAKSALLDPKVVEPAITDQMASETATVLEQRLQKPITLQADGKSATIEPSLLAEWVTFLPDTQNKKLEVGYNKDKIKQWLTPFAEQVYRPGQPRSVAMLDGEIVSSVDPADGVALNADATAEAITKAAIDKQTTVAAVTTPVTVAAQVVRNYTRSSKGLQALLNYWDSTNAGTWGIVLTTMDGGISATFNPDRQFTSASVYKLYVAYVTYTKTDNGQLSMNAATTNGNTVSGCLDRMIVRSDNDCAHELGNLIGWSNSDGMLHTKGFNSTSITFGGQLTTARDAAAYLTQLQNGSLLSAGNRSALLNKMSNNIYRYSIPAGSAGMASANKLGAFGAYNHDVAIVYHPKGTYVLSVFTYGSNHYRIRDLARQISIVMNQ